MHRLHLAIILMRDVNQLEEPVLLKQIIGTVCAFNDCHHSHFEMLTFILLLYTLTSIQKSVT